MASSVSRDRRPARDLLKGLIAGYFWLILIEGVLRKWILPGYSEIIYIVRDPLVIWIYAIAVMRGIFPARPALFVLMLIAMLSMVFSVITANPLMVTLFGLRTNYLHPPLLFVMGMVLNRDDVFRYCRWILLTSGPILLLMMQQFNSGGDSFLNAGVGGSMSSQLTGAMGKMRPSGPFSFVTGVVFYFGLLTAVVCHGWYRPQTHPRWLLIIGTAAVVISIPVSISRATLMSVLVVLIFVSFAVLNPRIWPKLLTAFVPLIIIALLLAWLRDTEYLTVFSARWMDALRFRSGGFMNNIVIRLLDDYLLPFQLAGETPILGHGVGRGTMAGARLIGGERGFLLAEGELGRVVMELGPFLGFAFITWRVWLGGTLLLNSWSAFRSTGDILPWVLAGAAFLSCVNAQWGQATMLGFTVFTCGLCAAALNRPPAPPKSRSSDEE